MPMISTWNLHSNVSQPALLVHLLACTSKEHGKVERVVLMSCTCA